jgi:hypothetical protein
MSYYNHRSLAYEPLLEPWYIQVAVSQLARFTQQEVAVSSAKMLNLNMTFGMALTVKKIKDRVLESVKQAEVLAKVDKGEGVSSEEQVSNTRWRQKFITSKTLKMVEEPGKQSQMGFVFQNYTGMEVQVAVHDHSSTDNVYHVSQTAAD